MHKIFLDLTILFITFKIYLVLQFLKMCPPKSDVQGKCAPAPYMYLRHYKYVMHSNKTGNKSHFEIWATEDGIGVKNYLSVILRFFLPTSICPLSPPCKF